MLMTIRENEYSNGVFFIQINELVIKILMHNVEIITQEATLTTTMVEPACAVYGLGGFHHVGSLSGFLFFEVKIVGYDS